MRWKILGAVVFVVVLKSYISVVDLVPVPLRIASSSTNSTYQAGPPHLHSRSITALDGGKIASSTGQSQQAAFL